MTIYRTIMSELAHQGLGDAGEYEALPADVKRFIQTNAAFWSDFFDENTFDDGYVLVDVTADNLKYIQSHCIVANYIAKERNLRPIYLTLDDPDPLSPVYNSFLPGDIVSLAPSDMDLQSIALSALDTIRRRISLHTLDYLPDLVKDDIRIGELAYNKIVRETGNPCLADASLSSLRYLFSTYALYHRATALFHDFEVNSLVLSHLFYPRCGLLAQLTASNDADVYMTKQGSHRETIRKYESVTGTRVPPLRPSEAAVEYVLEHHRETAVSRAESIVNDRLGVHPDAVERDARDSLPSSLTIDESLPTVQIMPHIFIEPLRGTRSLFKNYYEWFRQTVEFVADDRSANWLIKPHPHRHNYDQAVTASDVVSSVISDVDGHTITFLDGDVTHADLLSHVDLVLTLDGTAGTEYSCYGIPCILTSQSSYSGFGFTHEPSSQEEYFASLSDVSSIETLTPEQQTSAKVLIYLIFELMSMKPEFMPDEYHADDSRSEWDVAAAALTDADPMTSKYHEYVTRYLRSGARHFYDYSDVDFHTSVST